MPTDAGQLNSIFSMQSNQVTATAMVWPEHEPLMVKKLKCGRDVFGGKAGQSVPTITILP